MKITDFDYQLPAHLIAQYPTSERTASRLLKVESAGGLFDYQFMQIIDEFNAGDLLVLNNTKVVPARVFGSKKSGGKIELLLERPLSSSRFLAQIKASRAPKVGQSLRIDQDESAQLTVVGRQGAFFEVEIADQDNLFAWFERVGELPLPPYIERQVDKHDQSRYQTVFAEQQGAVAAPTAGLHFDKTLLDRIKQKGIQVATITLHVGAGTYQPVRVDNIQDHQMHAEFIEVNSQVCRLIEQTKAQGKRVIAVGTTVMRSLETAAQSADDVLIEPFSGETQIFIYPGFEFKVVDLLQTNFHLPKSTLMMLVSAFAGTEKIKQAYQHAIDQEYRFFSYGDAMLLERAE